MVLVASTKDFAIETSPIECPASGTMMSSEEGNFLCNSHALFTGQTMSYRPCTITAGMCSITEELFRI